MSATRRDKGAACILHLLHWIGDFCDPLLRECADFSPLSSVFMSIEVLNPGRSGAIED